MQATAQRVTLENQFHLTTATLRLTNGGISDRQHASAVKTTCGMNDCSCGNFLKSITPGLHYDPLVEGYILTTEEVAMIWGRSND